MDLDLDYPALSDLRERARRRIPHFAFEYLDSGTGRELEVQRNRDALDAVLFLTQILPGKVTPNFSTTFMGQDFGRPFGIAPVGMAGVMWPGAEKRLAKAAARHRIPYCLSSTATVEPEDIGPRADGMGWFQLYCPEDAEIRRDLLRRAKDTGLSKLVFTVDVPNDSRRERQRRAKLTLPPKITARTVWEVLTHPAWALGTLKEGAPRLRLAEGYVDDKSPKSSMYHAGHTIRGNPTWDTFDALRQEWDGDLIVKGLQRPEEAVKLVERGADAIWVSNHGGRQFEAGPASIKQLPLIRAAVGPDVPLLFDSGVQSGMDVLRALALGADFVMLGRAWHYAVAALEDRGIDHLVHILTDDMLLNMAQIGAHDLTSLGDLLLPD